MLDGQQQHMEENGKLGGDGVAAVQCARGSGASGRLQDLPVPDGEHSVAAAAALSMHQQVCHSTRMPRGGKDKEKGRKRGRELREM